MAWPGFRTCGSSVAVIVVAAAVGCATGDSTELQGKVTVAGVAVDAGSISLSPIRGTTGPTPGGFITGGRYRLTLREGVRPGVFLVKLHGSRKTGRKVDDASLPGRLMDEVVEAFPPEYGDKSTLEVEIKPGMNTFDIAVP